MGFWTSFKHIQVEDMLKTAQRFLPSIEVSMALTEEKSSNRNAHKTTNKIHHPKIELQAKQKVDLSRHKTAVGQNNETMQIK